MTISLKAQQADTPCNGKVHLLVDRAKLNTQVSFKNCKEVISCPECPYFLICPVEKIEAPTAPIVKPTPQELAIAKHQEQIDKLIAQMNDKQINKKLPPSTPPANKKNATATKKLPPKTPQRSVETKPHTIDVYAFTGMFIATLPILKETKTFIEVESKGKIVLRFDRATGVQTNAVNSRYANRVDPDEIPQLSLPAPKAE